MLIRLDAIRSSAPNYLLSTSAKDLKAAFQLSTAFGHYYGLNCVTLKFACSSDTQNLGT
jgi:hypothetical protein